MKRSRLLTVLFLIFTLLVSGCDSVGPSPRHSENKRIDVDYGLRLGCYSEVARYHTSNNDRVTEHIIGVYATMEFTEERHILELEDDLRDLQPLIQVYAPDGDLIREHLVPVFNQDGKLATNGGGVYLSGYEPVIGGAYRIVINENHEHSITLKEGICLDIVEPVVIDYDPLTREWNISWEHVAPHLEYEARIITSYGPFIYHGAEPRWTYTVPEPWGSLLERADIMIEAINGDGKVWAGADLPPLGVYDMLYGRTYYRNNGYPIPPTN